MHQIKGSGLEPWPQRLTSASPRLEEIGISAEAYKKDTVRLAPILPFLFGSEFIFFDLVSACDDYVIYRMCGITE